MNFQEALTLLKDNKFVYRKGWNAAGQWIKMQTPDENSKMSLPYLYIKNAQDKMVPWLASQGDLLAEDWEVK